MTYCNTKILNAIGLGFSTNRVLARVMGATRKAISAHTSHLLQQGLVSKKQISRNEFAYAIAPGVGYELLPDFQLECLNLVRLGITDEGADAPHQHEASNDEGGSDSESPECERPIIYRTHRGLAVLGDGSRALRSFEKHAERPLPGRDALTAAFYGWQ